MKSCIRTNKKGQKLHSEPVHECNPTIDHETIPTVLERQKVEKKRYHTQLIPLFLTGSGKLAL